MSVRPSILGLFVLALLPTVGGCSLFSRGEPLDEQVGLLAVLPVFADESDAGRGEDLAPRVAPEAGKVVTAQIYGVLAESPRWRYVPDLTVSEALRTHRGLGTPAEQAVELGRAVQADAVLTGNVSRFMQREGSEYGARKPAAVSLALELVSVRTGKVLWKDRFDKTQQDLSSNLFNWWMFWRAGPRWMTAEELARLGVERLMKDLDRHMPD